MTIREKLVHAVTAWDIKQSTKRFYNPYGLGIMLERVDEVATWIEAEGEGKTREAILAGFNDRLLDHVLRFVGLPTATISEHQGGQLTYTPKS